MWRMRAIQEKVSSAYYSYGHYCATHQLRMIGISFLTFCFVCYPLTRLPFLGTVPSRYVTPAAGYRPPPILATKQQTRADVTSSGSGLGGGSGGGSSSGSSSFGRGDPSPTWWSGPPAGYVLQILVKASVAPWAAGSLHALDAFRGPLHAVLDVIDTVGFVRRRRTVDVADDGASAAAEPWTFDEACLRVAEPRRAAGWRADATAALPEYGCLMLSPAALWGGSRQRFEADRDPLRTVYADVGGQYETLAGAPHIREVLFGVPWSESGVSKYYVRTRQRIIYYAVTLVLRNYSAGLVAALRERLLEKYPLSMLNYRHRSDSGGSRANASGSGADGGGDVGDVLTHVTYGQSETAFAGAYVFENLPLIVAYLVLFLYIYFSVQKIEMVKSKWGLALSAVATVVASLLMSFSICVSFGMRPSVSGSDIFPYLVVIVGLENMMVLTRAVASTELELEVPVRVAQGLGCEGWNISKYLLTELAVLAAGFFMLVPAVQEFCLFAIVGLFVDFFLQMTFFATVLSIDIRRLELEDLNRHRVYGSRMDANTSPARMPSLGIGGAGTAGAAHGVLGITMVTASGSMVHGSASGHLFGSCSFFAVPRRIRLMNFVAQKRCMQTLIIVTALLWIMGFLYNAGTIRRLLQSADTREQEAAAAALRVVAEAARDAALPDAVRRMVAPDSPLLPSIAQVLHKGGRGSDVSGHLDVMGRWAVDNWERLSFLHWPAVFAYYNVSLAGTYVTFLPSLKISLLVSPDEALALRKAAGVSGGSDVGAADDGKAEEDDAADVPAMVGDGGFALPAAGDDRGLPAPDDDHPRSMADDAIGDREAASAAALEPPSLLHELRLVTGLLLNTTAGLRGSSTLTGGAVFIFAAAAAALVFAFACVTLYRCMCGRNYHEWRPRWFRSSSVGGQPSRGRGSGSSTRARWRRHLTEGTVLSLDGHRQPVECMAVDGNLAATSCLGGEIRVWDAAAGQVVATVLRKSATATAIGAATADASRPSTPRSPLAHTIGGDRSRERCSSVGVVGDLSAFIETDFSSMSSRTFSSCMDAMHEHSRATTSEPLAASSPSLQRRGMAETLFASAIAGMCEAAPVATGAAAVTDSGLARSTFYAGDRAIGSRGSFQDELCHSFDQIQPTQESWPSIWCLTLRDGLVAAGCSDGTVELWDAVTGVLRGICRPTGSAGVTVVKLDGSRLMVGRADGTLDFVEIAHEVVDRRPTSSSPLPVAVVVARGRNGSRSSTGAWPDEDVRCTLVRSIKAHQSSVHFLEVGAGRAVTAGGGGQDASVLKIYSLDETCLLHVLRGGVRFSSEQHERRVPTNATASSVAIISALHVDTTAVPQVVVSGNRVGGVFVWDLQSGQNLHSWSVSRSGTTECDSGIASLVSSVQYVVASTSDGFIYVWNQAKNNLQHRIAAAGSNVSHVSLAFLTHRLLVAAAANDMRLHMWDAASGDIVHSIGLPPSVEHLNNLHVVSKQTILCSCGSRVLVLNFPKVREKLE